MQVADRGEQEETVMGRRLEGNMNVGDMLWGPAGEWVGQLPVLSP